MSSKSAKTKQKQPGKFVIITSSDSNCGDFLINHWLKSLKENVNLNLVDVVVLNYGLTKAQTDILLSEDVIVVDCVRDGHIVNLRYRDMLNFLKKNPQYEQILACDGGDIIFQRDISHLFEHHKNEFRGVTERIPISLYLYYYLKKSSFHKEYKEDISCVLKGKKVINGGFIIAPRNKFINLCQHMFKIIKKPEIFGPDQIVLNYVLYKEGFVEIETKYNYILTQYTNKFKIKEGIFYNNDGEVISVVHNAGHFKFFRTIDNLGYGKGHNKLNIFSYVPLKIFYDFLDWYILKFQQTAYCKKTKIKRLWQKKV
ncbi:MAG: glycosyl transferase family 8 [Candidatus Altiarchaeales archaeon HGW-Altiarchaeales-1]|nr:MAG: glycosyl transferase family 8 [Candidatus Altiarchaeales archaeon HGW-Altiarchaeales-1]